MDRVVPCPQDNVMMWWAEWFPALRTMLWCDGQSGSLPSGQCYDVMGRVVPCPKDNVMMWWAEWFPALRTMLWCDGQWFPALRTMLWCDGQSAPISECTSVYSLHSHVIVNPLSLITQHVHLKMEHYPCFRFCSAVQGIDLFQTVSVLFCFLAPQHILCKWNLFRPFYFIF